MNPTPVPPCLKDLWLEVQIGFSGFCPGCQPCRLLGETDAYKSACAQTLQHFEPVWSPSSKKDKARPLCLRSCHSLVQLALQGAGHLVHRTLLHPAPRILIPLQVCLFRSPSRYQLTCRPVCLVLQGQGPESHREGGAGSFILVVSGNRDPALCCPARDSGLAHTTGACLGW